MTRLKVKESPHGIAARTSTGADAVPVTSSDGADALPIRLTNDPSAWPVAYDMHAFYSATGINPEASALYLMTEERKNLLLNSENISDQWAQQTAVIAATGIPDPRGGSNATRMQSTGSDPSIRQNFEATLGKTVTISCWLRAEGSAVGKTARAAFLGPAFVNSWVSHTLTASWERVPFTATPTATNTGTARFFIPDSSVSGELVDVFGMQVNPGSLADYSPTGLKNALIDSSGNEAHGSRGAGSAAPAWVVDGLRFDGVNDAIVNGAPLGATWSKIWRKDGDTYAATSAGATYLNGVSSVFTVPVFETGGSFSGTLGAYIPLPGQIITEAQALAAHTWLEANT